MINNVVGTIFCMFHSNQIFGQTKMNTKSLPAVAYLQLFSINTIQFKVKKKSMRVVCCMKIINSSQIFSYQIYVRTAIILEMLKNSDVISKIAYLKKSLDADFTMYELT